MDWKYKHFDQEAIFRASPARVLEAARAVAADSLEEIEHTADGCIGRGYSAWHKVIATFRITPTPEGAKVAVELLVEWAAMQGFMLVDVGGYYNGQIDKWFSGITQRLEGTQGQILVSKTTSKVQQGCLLGCLVYLIVGAGLSILAFALDRALSTQVSASFPWLASIVVSLIGLIAGVLAFLYVAKPDAPAAKFLKEQLQRIQNKE